MLDDITNDPYPITPGTAGTVIGFDDCDHILLEWGDGRGLNLIPSVDKWHVIWEIRAQKITLIVYSVKGTALNKY